MDQLNKLPKLGIRAIKQVTAAIHSLGSFQRSAQDLIEAFEQSSVSKRHKGLQLNVNLALTKVSFSSARCRLEGEQLDTAIAKIILDALADTEKRRGRIAKGAIAQSLEPFNDTSDEPLD